MNKIEFDKASAAALRYVSNPEKSFWDDQAHKLIALSIMHLGSDDAKKILEFLSTGDEPHDVLRAMKVSDEFASQLVTSFASASSNQICGVLSNAASYLKGSFNVTVAPSPKFDEAVKAALRYVPDPNKSYWAHTLITLSILHLGNADAKEICDLLNSGSHRDVLREIKDSLAVDAVAAQFICPFDAASDNEVLSIFAVAFSEVRRFVAPEVVAA